MKSAKKHEIAKMQKAFNAIKNNKKYLVEATEILDGLNSELPNESSERTHDPALAT
ncbi:MAG: hypothetical protein ACD_29C00341G0004 [uncultured bacterium]|nr:MAG: hypothetical protein ACD_29C00341G0004 [uncultured bacterium]